MGDGVTGASLAGGVEATSGGFNAIPLVAAVAAAVGVPHAAPVSTGAARVLVAILDLGRVCGRGREGGDVCLVVMVMRDQVGAAGGDDKDR